MVPKLTPIPVGHGRQMARFDTDDERYMCCCGFMHCQRGAQIIGAVELVSLVLAFSILIGFFVTYNVTSYGYELLVSAGALAIGIILILVSFFVIGCMFVAIQSENHVLLVPHLAAQIFGLIGMLFTFIVSLVILIGFRGMSFGSFVNNGGMAYQETDLKAQIDPNAGKVIGAVVLVLSSLGFLLQCWFLAVIFSLYRYYRDKNKM